MNNMVKRTRIVFFDPPKTLRRSQTQDEFNSDEKLIQAHLNTIIIQ